MRVLLINAFHYLRGGVERAYFDESRWLAGAGHEVAHFATRDPRNQPSPTAAHFAPAADFGAGGAGLGQLTQASRAIWSRPAAEALHGLLATFRPEIAHVHAPSRYLTPSVIEVLARANVPQVMTLHDFKPWCTSRVMFARGASCERCKGGRHWHAVETQCVQGSLWRSAAGALEAYVHDARDAYRPIRRWIAPSRFVRDKVMEHGLEESRIRVLPHGFDDPSAETTTRPAPAGLPDRPFVLFAGRISDEKGVALLPTLALRIAPVPLVVAGGGPRLTWLEGQSAALPNLRVLGHLSAEDLAATLASAAVAVVPSLFYETYCFAAAEALLARRPVVASNIGAIPELVRHEETGLLVPPGDGSALSDAVRRALSDPAAAAWGQRGRVEVLESCDPARHLSGLLAVYREAISA